MTRRKLFTYALAFGASIARAEQIEHDHRIRLELEFDKYWQKYLLAEHGCPTVDDAVKKTLLPEDCVAAPYVDAHSYTKARELAKDIFRLKEV